MELYQVFVDLKKAFNTVNCTGLWWILSKLGCPHHFWSPSMVAWRSVGGALIATIKDESRVKQGDLLAPIIFSIYFEIVLLDAFEELCWYHDQVQNMRQII